MLLSLLKNIFRESDSPLKDHASRDKAILSDVEESNSSQRKVLNVGGNSKLIPIPPQYQGWRHDLLDIDAEVNPDIVCDSREMGKLAEAHYDQFIAHTILSITTLMMWRKCGQGFTMF